jgi:hypothetical protein
MTLMMRICHSVCDFCQQFFFLADQNLVCLGGGGVASKVIDEPYFFVERRMAPHRLPAISDSSSMASEVPPPDFWSRPIAKFQTLEQAQRAFDHPHLLHSFFNKMDEMLNLIEANAGTADFSTNLARQMVFLILCGSVCAFGNLLSKLFTD